MMKQIRAKIVGALAGFIRKPETILNLMGSARLVLAAAMYLVLLLPWFTSSDPAASGAAVSGLKFWTHMASLSMFLCGVPLVTLLPAALLLAVRPNQVASIVYTYSLGAWLVIVGLLVLYISGRSQVAVSSPAPYLALALTVAALILEGADHLLEAVEQQQAHLARLAAARSAPISGQAASLLDETPGGRFDPKSREADMDTANMPDFGVASLRMKGLALSILFFAALAILSETSLAKRLTGPPANTPASGPTPTPWVGPQPGWKDYRVDIFSLALPEGWSEADVVAGGMEPVWVDMESGQSGSNINNLRETLKLYAEDRSETGKTSSVVMVSAYTKSSPIDPLGLCTQIDYTYEKTPGYIVFERQCGQNYNGIPAMRFKVQSNNKVSRIVYYYVHDNQYWEVLIDGGTGAGALYKQTFDAIGQSFRLNNH